MRHSNKGRPPRLCPPCRGKAHGTHRARWEIANRDKIEASRQRYEAANADIQAERRRLWNEKNKDRRDEQIKAWREQNRDRRNAVERTRRAKVKAQDPGAAYLAKKRQHLRHKYGLDMGDYDAMLARQGYGCAICGDPPERVYSFHVDHDHETGHVRGLLCKLCNPLLGLAREEVGVLASAIEYLKGGRDNGEG